MHFDEPTLSRIKNCEEELEARGWLRSIAKSDFELGAKVVATLYANKNLGVIVSGAYGSGKTAFVRRAFPHARFYQMPMAEGVLDPDYGIPEGDVILDDMGAEHSVNDFGIRKEPFADFVVRFHANPRRGRLIITTNLSTQEFNDRYGGRVVSRLKDLCVATHFTGGDKREWTIIK